MTYKRRRKGYHYDFWVKPFLPKRKPRPRGKSADKSSNLAAIGLALFLLYIVLVFVLHHPTMITAAVGIVVSLLAVVIWANKRSQNAKKREVTRALLDMGATNPMQLSPHQYEQLCGALLEKNGWKVQYTSRTGDQGADLIAEKPGQRVVIQCKQWSSSVRVKAVQEVHSACSYYTANKGFVVSTAGYTSGAKDLAKKVGVALLSHADLSVL